MWHGERRARCELNIQICEHEKQTFAFEVIADDGDDVKLEMAVLQALQSYCQNNDKLLAEVFGEMLLTQAEYSGWDGAGQMKEPILTLVEAYEKIKKDRKKLHRK